MQEQQLCSLLPDPSDCMILVHAPMAGRSTRIQLYFIYFCQGGSIFGNKYFKYSTKFILTEFHNTNILLSFHERVNKEREREKE